MDDGWMNEGWMEGGGEGEMLYCICTSNVCNFSSFPLDVFKQAVEEFDHVDVLINNAGVGHVPYDEIIAVNLVSKF